MLREKNVYLNKINVSLIYTSIKKIKWFFMTGSIIVKKTSEWHLFIICCETKIPFMNFFLKQQGVRVAIGGCGCG